MSIESKSSQLKELVSQFDSLWFVGDLFALVAAGPERAPDQLGQLSSPMRQLYYLAGLNLTSPLTGKGKTSYSEEEWKKMVRLLNDIEAEYIQFFTEKADELKTSGEANILKIAIPTFFSYFNQGPLNYEEQEINLMRDTFATFDALIQQEMGFSVENLITFYNSLDQQVRTNTSAHMGSSELLRENWEEYSTVPITVMSGVPEDIIAEMDEMKPFLVYMSDKGIAQRFRPEELVSDNLSVDIINRILNKLAFTRHESDFLYYADSENPIFQRPIISLENGLYHVCEVKQVIHAIRLMLEDFIEGQGAGDTKGAYNNKKGKVLEARITEVLTAFFGNDDFQMYTSFDLDGNEQDILVIWKAYAIIFEAKAINIREPMREPSKAYDKIKSDFKSTIQTPYNQAFRVKRKFHEGEIFTIRDTKKKTIELDATKVEECFIVVVTQSHFGPIQTDLSYLLQLHEEDEYYPWAVKIDDLEVLLLTMTKRKARIKDFVNFLRFRQTLHGRLFCDDELEVCGGFLTRKLNPKTVKNHQVFGNPTLSDIFDEQYRNGMGFKDEKLLQEKLSDNNLFI